MSRCYLKCPMRSNNGSLGFPRKKYIELESGGFAVEDVSFNSFIAYIRHYGRHWVSEKDGNGKWKDYIVTGDIDLYWEREEC